MVTDTRPKPNPEFQMIPVRWFDCVASITLLRGGWIDLCVDDPRTETPSLLRLSTVEARALACALVAAADGGEA